MSKQASLAADLLHDIPHHPGVYLFRDAAEEVIYVGKARDLRKRLAAYAREQAERDAKTALMLSKVRSLATILTATEKEALILEAALIKQHRPRYNINLRDDKNYPLLKVTVDEEFPRLLVVRRRTKDGGRYFGPFSAATAMRETVAYLQGLFPLRRCKGREIRKRDRPCLNFQMGRCSAPCFGKIDQERYQEMVRSVLLFLEGKSDQLVRGLEERMRIAAAELRFEEAAQLRDRLQAIKETLEKQTIVADHARNQIGRASCRERV